MKKMLVIDGNSIINRAFYGIRPLTNKDGLPTNALFGFINIILKHIQSISPDYAAIAFDVKSPTFRHKSYSEYKAGRHAMPDELVLQMPYAKKTADAMGFAVLEKEGYEADDILGTLSRMGDEEGVEVYVLTGDRDSFQLISDNTKVLLATNSDTIVVDRARFFEKYSIEPDQFVDLKALMGDSSDNIPGVAGVGEKTAIRLISSEGSLEKLYENIDEKNISESVRNKLIKDRDNAFMSQFLARIERNVPLERELSDIKYNGIKNEELMELLTQFEFFSVIKRLGLTTDTAVREYDECDAEALAALPKDKLYALHINTDILYICSSDVSYKISAASASDFISSSEYKKLVYDVKSYYSYYSGLSIEFKGCVCDIMLAAYLNNPSDSVYDIPRLATAFLGTVYEEGKSDDAALIYELYPILMKELESADMQSLLNDIEMPLAHTLSKMEKRGFKVSRKGLEDYAVVLSALEDDLTERIYCCAGCDFNINSPKQLGEVLFEKLGLPAVKKTKTGYSTNAETLEKLRPYSPIIDDILEYRQVSKLKSTYVDGLLKVAESDDRVHTKFNQSVTATGRLSSTEPNLQNIPVRQEMGRELRKFFIPENEEYVLIDADYSQIELRLLAHISGDRTMKRAFVDGVDIHTLTASQVFGVPPEAVNSEQRKRAKAVNFGIIYGMGDFSLAADIGVSKFQAGEYIKSYFRKYPSVDMYMKNTVEQAKLDGYVTTLFGRRRYIPELKSAKAILRKFGERVAMNSPIQGTAADIIKIAMINTERALEESGIEARLILQIHDELIIESKRDCAAQAEEILRREMENAVKLDVPLTVEIQTGNSWYECK